MSRWLVWLYQWQDEMFSRIERRRWFVPVVALVWTLLVLGCVKAYLMLPDHS